MEEGVERIAIGWRESKEKERRCVLDRIKKTSGRCRCVGGLGESDEDEGEDVSEGHCGRMGW